MARRQRYPSHVQAAISAAVSKLDTRPRVATIELELPWPPSLNNAYPTVVTRTGRPLRVKSQRAVQYIEGVVQRVGAWLSEHGVRPPLPPYTLTIHIYPPADGRRHDGSNLIKVPEDALMAAIRGDDDDVRVHHLYKHDPDGYPRIVVTLEGVGE